MLSASDLVWWYHHNRRICNKEPSLCLWFSWQLQAFYCVLPVIYCFQFFFLVRNSEYWTHVLSLVTILANCVWLNWLNLGNIFSNCLAVCYRTCIWSSVNICAIHLAEIFLTFKIRKKIIFIRKSTILKALVISRIVYLPSLSIISLTFETVALSVTVTCRPEFAAILKDSVPDRNFLFYLWIVS